jgi:hypothetical protein
MALVLDEPLQLGEALLPPCFQGIPRPPRQLLQSALAIRIHLPFLVCPPLNADPLPEFEPILDVIDRHPGVALALDEPLQLGEGFLPLRFEGIPRPSRKFLQAALLLRVELPRRVVRALIVHPAAQLETVLLVEFPHAGMALTLDEPLQ